MNQEIERRFLVDIHHFSFQDKKKSIKQAYLFFDSNQVFRIRKIGHYSILSILKLNVLPYVIGIYFISLVVLNNQELYHLTNFPFLLVLVTIIALLLLHDTFIINSAWTSILVLFSIVQVYLLSLNLDNLSFNIDQSNLYILFYLIK